MRSARSAEPSPADAIRRAVDIQAFREHVEIPGAVVLTGSGFASLPTTSAGAHPGNDEGRQVKLSGLAGYPRAA